MSNPSTIWSQLASPNSAVGSLPFVYLDGTTIVTDILNYYYTQVGDPTIGVLSKLAYQLTVKNGLRTSYGVNLANSPTVTLNEVAGRILLAAGTTSRTILCDKVNLASIIHVQFEGPVDATAYAVQVTAQQIGTFTIGFNAAPTGSVVVSFDVQNVIA